MDDIEQLKEAILNYYPRLSEESSFTFACHPGGSVLQRLLRRCHHSPDTL
jgi:hypothetical protein